MKFGVCYYPEHWPESRWETDARMMRDAGIEIVRIAEFAWSRMEPVEGSFDFAWLDRAIKTLAQEGHKIVLGTPTATPPAWLSRNYPETLPIDESGRRRNFGARRHYCANTPTYRNFTKRIVTAIAQKYAEHTDVIGWQIDNEFGGGGTTYCYCDDCAAAFQDWLKKRYGSLNSLNTAWGAVFWSQEYSAWEQISAPNLTGGKPNPSQQLDYFRFSSDTWVDFQAFQIGILKESIRPAQQFVTHNMMGLFFRDINYFDLAKDLDFVSVDNYPTGGIDRVRDMLYIEENPPAYAADVGDPILTHLEFDLMRGLKNKPFWVMEQQPGLINWSTYNTYVPKETVRLWSWHAVLQGADTLVFFRWRPSRFAQEQYHSGMLRHDGEPAEGLLTLKVLHKERDLLSDYLKQPREAEVGIVLRYEDMWSQQIQAHRRGYSYLGHLFTIYSALTRLGIQVDICSPEANFENYKLIVSPSPHMNDPEFTASLRTYVEKGGRWLATIRAGFKTPSNLVTEASLPGEFRDLLGVTVPQWTALAPGISFPLKGTNFDGIGPAKIWADAFVPESAETLIQYQGGPFAGKGALTKNIVGEGVAYALGWHPTSEQALSILQVILDEAGVRSITNRLPAGVLAVLRGSRIAFLNFNEISMEFDSGWEKIRIPARDIHLTERK